MIWPDIRSRACAIGAAVMVGLAGATGREYGTGTDSCPTLNWGRVVCCLAPKSEAAAPQGFARLDENIAEPIDIQKNRRII